MTANQDAKKLMMSVVELNDSAKKVVDSAFQLHLLGLNARVFATQLGETARGFGVLSAEWVIISATLSEMMAKLEEVSAKLLYLASSDIVRSRRRRIMEEAVEKGSAIRDSVKNYRRQWKDSSRQERAGFETVRSSLRDVVDESIRASMSGLVIARTAKIEAASAGNSAVTLTQLAVDFETNLSEVMPSLTQLKKLEERGLR